MTTDIIVKISNHCLSCFLSNFAISLPGMREILYFKSKLSPHQMWVCSPSRLFRFSLSRVECPDPVLKGSNPARISVLPCWQCFNLGFQFLWWKYFLPSGTENPAGRRSSRTGFGRVCSIMHLWNFWSYNETKLWCCLCAVFMQL